MKFGNELNINQKDYGLSGLHTGNLIYTTLKENGFESICLDGHTITVLNSADLEEGSLSNMINNRYKDWKPTITKRDNNNNFEIQLESIDDEYNQIFITSGIFHTTQLDHDYIQELLNNFAPGDNSKLEKIAENIGITRSNEMKQNFTTILGQLEKTLTDLGIDIN